MADISNLNVFADQIATSFMFQFRKFVIFLAIALMVIIFMYFLILLIIKIKTHRKITQEQNEILHKGKIYAKNLKLNKLFSSVDGTKMVYLGKILAYVKIREGKKIYSVFAVKKGIMDYFFYKVEYGDHSELFGDVTLYEWNFILDKQNVFMIPNCNYSVKYVERKEDSYGVDTIGMLSSLIQKAVQVNPLHRIRLRESKLIKIPDENISSIAESVSSYLRGK